MMETGVCHLVESRLAIMDVHNLNQDWKDTDEDGRRGRRWRPLNNTNEIPYYVGEYITWYI